MGRNDVPRAAHPEDPLNSYQPASWRSVIITGVLILVVFVGLWLAYGAVLSSGELQRQQEGNPEVQGEPFPGDPEPGGF